MCDGRWGAPPLDALDPMKLKQFSVFIMDGQSNAEHEPDATSNWRRP